MAKGDSPDTGAGAAKMQAPKMDQYSVMHRMFDHFSPGANKGITPQPMQRSNDGGQMQPQPMQQLPMQQMPDMTSNGGFGAGTYGSEAQKMYSPSMGGTLDNGSSGIAPMMGQMFGGGNKFDAYGGGNPQQFIQQQQNAMGMGGGAMAPDMNNIAQMLGGMFGGASSGGMNGGSNGFLDPSRYGGRADPRFNY